LQVCRTPAGSVQAKSRNDPHVSRHPIVFDLCSVRLPGCPALSAAVSPAPSLITLRFFHSV
jgi:hypothetical protein